jgi:hypothetical protein
LDEDGKVLRSPKHGPLTTPIKNAFADWVNKADVREILNIPVDVKAWELCSDIEY